MIKARTIMKADVSFFYILNKANCRSLDSGWQWNKV